MKLLLDTCSFLWLITGDPKLIPPVREAIRSPENGVWLSVISFWEILVKHALGRLSLPEPPGSYVPRQRERHKVDALGLEEAAVRHMQNLPSLHRDPFDRMLICQAIEHELTLVTPDSAIQAYPVKIFWAP